MPYSESEVGRPLPLAKSDVRTVSIDGVAVSEVLVPGDAQETAEALAEAATSGRAVSPVGGGTALNLGNPPERVDCVLATERLAGIIDYEPTDLVMSVGAGARFGDVQAVLAEHGQRLPLDPPGGADATIGGLIATARWGPLRYSAGTLRDLLIGISVAHSSGTVSKAGGMVVKNVSGYDMPRLYLGSLGTLGVVVSANFKVLPRPRVEATVVATYDEPTKAFAMATALRDGREPVAALEGRAGAFALPSLSHSPNGRPEIPIAQPQQAGYALGSPVVLVLAFSGGAHAPRRPTEAATGDAHRHGDRASAEPCPFGSVRHLRARHAPAGDAPHAVLSVRTLRELYRSLDRPQAWERVVRDVDAESSVRHLLQRVDENLSRVIDRCCSAQPGALPQRDAVVMFGASHSPLRPGIRA